MILAVDFNHVLHNRDNPIEGKRMGGPIYGAQEAMHELREAGHRLYIFTDMANTARGYGIVSDWLGYYGIPWDYITDKKPQRMDALIDDKAIRFENWGDTLSAILKLNEHRPQT